MVPPRSNPATFCWSSPLAPAISGNSRPGAGRSWPSTRVRPDDAQSLGFVSLPTSPGSSLSKPWLLRSSVSVSTPGSTSLSNGTSTSESSSSTTVSVGLSSSSSQAVAPSARIATAASAIRVGVRVVVLVVVMSQAYPFAGDVNPATGRSARVNARRSLVSFAVDLLGDRVRDVFDLIVDAVEGVVEVVVVAVVVAARRGAEREQGDC